MAIIEYVYYSIIEMGVWDMNRDSPAPNEIRELRKKAGLTQEKAGILVHTKLRAFQKWEAGDARMHPGLWELFLIKTGFIGDAL